MRIFDRLFGRKPQPPPAPAPLDDAPKLDTSRVATAKIVGADDLPAEVRAAIEADLRRRFGPGVEIVQVNSLEELDGEGAPELEPLGAPQSMIDAIRARMRGEVEEPKAKAGFKPAQPIDPWRFPEDHKSKLWEAVHQFNAYGAQPHRHDHGVCVPEPPLAMVCPNCDLKQPIMERGARRCEYCGVHLQVHGSRVYYFYPEQDVRQHG